jgi:hypothetical protein
VLVIDPDAYVDGPRTRDALSDAWAWANRDLRDLLGIPSLERVHVMIGVPGAGKSAWASSQPDDDGAIAFDAVHADPARRRSIVRRIRDAGKRAIAVHVLTDIATCADRNAARPIDRQVPHGKLLRCAMILRSQPPRLAEGWHEIRNVRAFELRHDARTVESKAKRFGHLFYRWRSLNDDRVRPEHLARHGRLYAWAYPPEDGHPGEPYGCRCKADDVQNDDVVETRSGDLRARPLTVPTWARERPR